LSDAPGALPAVSQGDIGVEGPLSLLAASQRGAWVALCQGQPPTARLVLGSGLGEPIEQLYAQDPTGRYLVVQQAASAVLLDAVTGSKVDLSALGADVRRVRADYAVHRTLSFSADGQRLAYLRRQDGKSSIVVRQLQTGSEQVYAAGAGEVFRLWLSADGRYVSIDALREDTNRNGRLDWPAPAEAESQGSCQKPPLPRFRSYGYQGRGDASSRAVLALGDGTLRDLPELVTPLGPQLVVREADGSLRLDQNGKRSPLSPATCAGRVLFADAERGLLLVACALPKKTVKREVWLLGSGFAKNLHSELYETGTDREAVVGTRLVPLYPGSDAALVDLERRELLPLAQGSRVLAAVGDAALVWRGSELFRYDARTKQEQRLAKGVLKNPDLLQAGTVVLLSPFVIANAAEPALTSPSEHPLALSSTGHVLAPASAAASSGAIEGPLHWLDARVAAP
jgi:hypothetical protein